MRGRPNNDLGDVSAAVSRTQGITRRITMELMASMAAEYEAIVVNLLAQNERLRGRLDARGSSYVYARSVCGSITGSTSGTMHGASSDECCTYSCGYKRRNRLICGLWWLSAVLPI